ncbi:MAG TPA: putative phage tail protein [Xanthobacteraceae bacterium]|nr:putative phage tail protein [Xanthobacteraceae bacterium]
MSDRHLRRLGQDYGSAFLTLLPQGQAWPKAPGTTLDLACRGLAEYWGFVDSRAADLLERESDPRYTLELLPDWERNWGLPDPCYEAPQSYAERIAGLLARMTMQGGQSREFFINVAATIGYTITITEYRTFVVGIDRVGDARVYGAAGAPDPVMYNEWGNPWMNAAGNMPVAEGELSEWPYYGLGPETNRHYWTVHVSEAKLTWFRVGSGQVGVDPHLRIGLAEDLECLLDRLKPAHTEIIYDYSGLGSLGDPMAGTP